ncbi:MAG: hypothetical protein ABIZ05_12850 [Pseudonocardiaceae bacterium]
MADPEPSWAPGQWRPGPNSSRAEHPQKPPETGDWNWGAPRFLIVFAVGI